MNPKHFETAYRISPDDFFDLIERVEAEGGASLNEPCKATLIDALSKPGDPAYTHGCGEAVRFQIPYDSEGDEKFVTACANGDLMERWPRFMRELETA